MIFFKQSPGKLLTKLFLTVLAVILLLSTFSTVHASTIDGTLVGRKELKPQDGINITQLTYMSDGLRVHGLLFEPVSKEKLPCIIFNHDGISGISKEHKLSSIRLAKDGYVVFSPSYRGEDGSEGEIEIAKGEVRDVLNAITLVSSLKSVNKDKIALAGASHGSLISILAAAQTDKVKAVVAAYGVNDIYKWWDYLKKANKVGKDKITRQTYGDGPQHRPTSFAIRNAINRVPHLKSPVLILQGAKDDIVPAEQARFLKQELDKHNITNEMYIYPDCLHGFLVYAPFLTKNVTPEERSQTEEAWKTMFSFLKKNLK